MLIFAVDNPLIQRHQLGLELLLERGEVLMDGVGQAGLPGLLHQAVLLLPGRSADQVILETVEAHAVAAEQIARLQRIAQLAVDQHLIAVKDEPFLACAIAGIQLAPQPHRHELGCDRLRRQLPQRAALGEGGLQALHGGHERRIRARGMPLSRQEQQPEMALQALGLAFDMRPLHRDVIHVQIGTDILRERLVLLPVQDGEGPRAHALKGPVGGDLVRGEELEKLPDLGQIGIVRSA